MQTPTEEQQALLSCPGEISSFQSTQPAPVYFKKIVAAIELLKIIQDKDTGEEHSLLYILPKLSVITFPDGRNYDDAFDVKSRMRKEVFLDPHTRTEIPKKYILNNISINTLAKMLDEIFNKRVLTSNLFDHAAYFKTDSIRQADLLRSQFLSDDIAEQCYFQIKEILDKEILDKEICENSDLVKQLDDLFESVDGVLVPKMFICKETSLFMFPDDIALLLTGESVHKSGVILKKRERGVFDINQYMFGKNRLLKEMVSAYLKRCSKEDINKLTAYNESSLLKIAKNKDVSNEMITQDQQTTIPKICICPFSDMLISSEDVSFIVMDDDQERKIICHKKVQEVLQTIKSIIGFLYLPKSKELVLKVDFFEDDCLKNAYQEFCNEHFSESFRGCDYEVENDEKYKNFLRSLSEVYQLDENKQRQLKAIQRKKLGLFCDSGFSLASENCPPFFCCFIMVLAFLFIGAVTFNMFCIQAPVSLPQENADETPSPGNDELPEINSRAYCPMTKWVFGISLGGLLLCLLSVALHFFDRYFMPKKKQSLFQTVFQEILNVSDCVDFSSEKMKKLREKNSHRDLIENILKLQLAFSSKSFEGLDDVKKDEVENLQNIFQIMTSPQCDDLLSEPTLCLI